MTNTNFNSFNLKYIVWNSVMLLDKASLYTTSSAYLRTSFCNYSNACLCAKLLLNCRSAGTIKIDR